MLSYDRTTLFPKINLHVDKEDGEPGYLRFINRLRFIKNVYNGFSINARDLHIDKINVDMKFDIYSAIFSVIYIEVFNEILGKFESLSIDGEQDEIFVSCLYGELNFKLIYRCSCNDLFEMICLHNDMNIDKFPDIKMDVLFKKLSAIYNEDVANHISEILYNSIIDDINKMVKKNKIDNNPEDVFDYFYFNINCSVIAYAWRRTCFLILFVRVHRGRRIGTA